MTDFILSAPDEATMNAAFQAAGFWADSAPLTQGRIPGDPGPNASYFLNIVGTVTLPTGELDTNGLPILAPVPGWFARLRINGLNPFAGQIAIPTGVTIYAQRPDVGWSSDGVTPAPDYVASVGCIA